MELIEVIKGVFFSYLVCMHYKETLMVGFSKYFSDERYFLN